MRKVIDSNYLRAPEFELYLSKSTLNYAILTDYVAKEAYKNESIHGLMASMEIACRYPEQIIILKCTRTVCGLKERGSGLQKRLIDNVSTRKFCDYADKLRLAFRGHCGAEAAVARHRQTAVAELNNLLSDAETIRKVLGSLSQKYTKEERGIIRQELSFTEGMKKKLRAHTLNLACELIRSHPEARMIPVASSIKNRFLFRLALCMCLLDLRWGTQGGVSGANAKTISHDMVDMYIVSYATYFDGLLSKEPKMVQVYRQACHHLNQTFI